MSAFIDALGWTLVHFLWQGALIGLAAAAALYALRTASARLRYAVACGAMLLCVLWPAAELLGRLTSSTATEAAVLATLSELPQAHGVWRPLLQQHIGILVAIWAACTGALALRTATGMLWIEHAARHGRAHAAWQLRTDRLARALGIARTVRLRIVEGLASPITAGWWRPVVLVPASLVSGLPADLLEALIAHELAHVRRYDYLVNLLQNVVETVLFYHPAVWWLSRRIRAERELIADELASTHTGARRLALALSELEKLQFSHQSTAVAANGGDLMQRITHLLQPVPKRSGWKSAAPLALIAAGCIALAGCATVTDDPHAPVDQKALADFRSCKKPVWPESSLAAEHQGTVHLMFLIDEQGKVSDSKLVKSSGDPLLDDAARTGISKCSFKPATRNGKAVASWSPMQYVWTLQ